MIAEEALQLVVSRLEESGIPYMITGSFASNLHGVPRTTQGADLVIEADRGSLDRFLESLGAVFYVSPEAAEEALKNEGIFNVVHLETGFKIDLIIRKSRLFSQTEFSRRKRALFLGQNRWFASAEDIILAKLEWAKMGGSERQFEDAVSVAKIQGNDLDRAYLQIWAKALEIGDLLDRLLHSMSLRRDQISEMR